MIHHIYVSFGEEVSVNLQQKDRQHTVPHLNVLNECKGAVIQSDNLIIRNTKSLLMKLGELREYSMDLQLQKRKYVFHKLCFVSSCIHP